MKADRIVFAVALVMSQVSADALSAQRGRVVTDTVRSPSLANLLGAPAETRVLVYLPPSYGAAPQKRYPVIYLLHGAGVSATAWLHSKSGGPVVDGIMDSLIATNTVKEMIVVMPNATTRFISTFYVNSQTTGNWEDFFATDLVAWTDGRYRTLAQPESRGIAGHSAGGYGAFYLGMRHGGTVYGAMYPMSACCSVGFSFQDGRDGATWDTVASVNSFAGLAHAGFRVQGTAALSAAFAPDRARPPLFFSLAEERKDGTWKANAPVIEEWDAHTPALMVPTYRANLLRMRGIQFDVGTRDETVPPTELIAMNAVLSRASIPHAFELFDGTHSDHVLDRLMTSVFPFFSRTLLFGPAKP